MKFTLRCAMLLILACLSWPEIARQQAEWRLAVASGQIERAMRGIDTGPQALAAVQQAGDLAQASMVALPGDARAAHLLGIALILQGRGAEAIEVLEAAIMQGERPELTLNLGRARSLLGDEAGAQRAFLRTAWASPLAIASLPGPMREALQQQVRELETELRGGRLAQPPPLDLPPPADPARRSLHGESGNGPGGGDP